MTSARSFPDRIRIAVLRRHTRSMPPRKLAVLNIGQCLTMAGACGPGLGAENQLGISSNGLLIEGGQISFVGPDAEVERRMGDAQVLDAGGRLVTPGLVDAHTHLVFGGDRSLEFEKRCQGATYQEIATKGGGILETVRQTRDLAEDALLGQSRGHARWILACGTTTAEVKSGYGLDVENELKMLRVIRRLREEGPMDLVPTFLGLHALPKKFKERPDEYVSSVCEDTLPKVVSERLAEYADAFCEPAYFTLDQTRRFLLAAKKQGLGLRLHADQLTSSGGAELASELGATTADHLEQTGPEGIAALARAGVQPVLLPGSVAALGHTKYPDARSMLDAGLDVVLATDFNPGSSPMPSLPMAMSIACTHMRMTPAEAWLGVSVHAALSLGRAHDRGSLEPGKRADFVVWDAADYREIPYWFGRNAVREVWIGGVRAV